MIKFLKSLFGITPSEPAFTRGYKWAMDEYSKGTSVDAIYIQADSAFDYNDFDRGAHRACVELVLSGAQTELGPIITGEAL